MEGNIDKQGLLYVRARPIFIWAKLEGFLSICKKKISTFNSKRLYLAEDFQV